MKKEDIDNLDSLEDSIWFNIFNKLAMSLGIIGLGSTILVALNIPILLSLLILTPTLGPLSYIGITKLKEKMDEDFKSDLQAIDQISKLFVEIEEKDHKITKHSVCFYQEIQNDSILASLDNSSKTNINQFLYMINANYYKAITKTHGNLKREDLIARIINQISLYMSDKHIDSFRVKEAEVTNESIQHNLSLFDVNDIERYEFLLKCFGKDSESTKEYGEVSSVEWHLFTLRDIMSFTLNNFPQELTNIKGEFYNSQVVMDFV